MANPMDAFANAADLQHIKSLLVANINEDELMKSMQLMAAKGKINLKFGRDTKDVTRQVHVLIVRFTPVLHQQLMKLAEEVAKNHAHMPTDVKKKASDEFSAAIKTGQVIVEVNEDGKKTAFTSKQVAQKLQDGSLQLKTTNGKVKKYDDVIVKVINDRDFEELSATCLKSLQSQAPAQAKVASTQAEAKPEAIAETAKEKAPPPKMQTAEKKVPVAPVKDAEASKESKQAKEAEQLEKAIEAERDKIHEKTEIDKQVIEREEKIKKETVKHEAQAADTQSKDVQSKEVQKQTAEATTDSPLTKEAPDALPSDASSKPTEID